MYLIRSGRVEVYACSPKGAKNFHKLFLMELGPQESFFSPVDVVTPLEFQIFALSDVEIEPVSPETSERYGLMEGASLWFNKLTDLQWIRYLVGLNDDKVLAWDSRTVFEGAGDESEVIGKLKDNLEIMSILITGQFNSLEQNVEVKMKGRKKHIDDAMSSAIQSLSRTERGVSEDADTKLYGDAMTFAVKAVARHFGMETDGISIPFDIASKLDAVTGMRRLIRKGNMQARLIALPDGWYEDDCGVMLAYYSETGKGDQLAALIPNGGRGYLLMNEEYPFGRPVDADLASRIKRDAFVCYAGFAARKLNGGDILKFMLRHGMQMDWRMVWIMSVIAGLLPLMLPFITETIFSDVIPVNDRQALATVTQVMLVSGFTTVIVAFVRSISLFRIKTRVGNAFESAVLSRLLNLPAKFFRQFDAGDLVGRLRGVTRLTELIGDNIMSSVFNMIFSFWSLMLMFYYSIKLTLAAIVIWAVYIFVNSFICKKTIMTKRKEAEASNKSSAVTLQILNGLSKFRLQGCEVSAFNIWAEAFGEEWKWKLKLRWYSNYTLIVNAITPTVLSLAVFYMTLNMVKSGSETMNAARFMAFQAAFTGFNATLVGFIPIVTTIFSSIPYFENILPILETEPEVTDDKTDASELSGEIEIRNVSFSYGPDLPMVLNGVSLHIKAGECVAFVGASGCGKSTLIRMLLGFEKPAIGGIFFDGQDLSMLNSASVRSQMGVVLQNGQILAGDIFTNIVGSTPLSHDDAWEAARMVGLDKDIENMPMGMHTVISEGAGNISGGQRQRILLARSIVNKPKIIILDEATSALDNTTQAIVTESMNSMKATRLLVAHRLSTIKEADRICVLQNGVITEEGNYGDLMKLDGLFAKLAKRQLAEG
jgi:ATP-binding cassette subfamily C protein